ncbi:hypothetical protein FBU30_001682 [Linnemannia zychae]|nr:hypothetical protein FBU30_001682 [Linnemannia zychae]
MGADRKLLKEDFDQWNISKGASYWMDNQARLSVMKAAGTLMEASEPHAEDSLRRASKMKTKPAFMLAKLKSGLKADTSINAESMDMEDCKEKDGFSHGSIVDIDDDMNNIDNSEATIDTASTGEALNKLIMGIVTARKEVQVLLQHLHILLL